jgi:hypothetical protein
MTVFAFYFTAARAQTNRMYYIVVKKDVQTKIFLFDSLVPKLEPWCNKITMYIPIGMVSANCTKELIEASATNTGATAVDILNGLPEVVTLSANLPDQPAKLSET